MTDLRYHHAAPATESVHIPRQRDRARLTRAVSAVEEWLDNQSPDDSDSDRMDAAEENLRRISALLLADAPEAELAVAVHRARATGWGWAPIALLLGQSREQARRRFQP